MRSISRLLLFLMIAVSGVMVSFDSRAELDFVPCSERDYRGLNLQGFEFPGYAELVCQMRMIMQNSMNPNDIEIFVMIRQQELGMLPSDIVWEQPKNMVVRDLINYHLERGSRNVAKLARALHAWHSEKRPQRPGSERELLQMLAAIELQTGGVRR